VGLVARLRVPDHLDHILRGLRAHRWVDLETRLYRGIPTRIEILHQRSRLRRSLGQASHRDAPGRTTGERPRAGDHFEQHQAERVDVGSGRECLAPYLLRRHVGGGADDDSRIGKRRQAFLAFDRPGEAEVRNHRPAPSGLAADRDHHIRGFEVAMEHAGSVRGAKALGHALEDRESLCGGHPPGIDPIGEILSAE